MIGFSGDYGRRKAWNRPGLAGALLYRYELSELISTPQYSMIFVSQFCTLPYASGLNILKMQLNSTAKQTGGIRSIIQNTNMPIGSTPALSAFPAPSGIVENARATRASAPNAITPTLCPFLPRTRSRKNVMQLTIYKAIHRSTLPSRPNVWFTLVKAPIIGMKGAEMLPGSMVEDVNRSAIKKRVTMP